MFLYYRKVKGFKLLIENMNLQDRYILEILLTLFNHSFYFILFQSSCIVQGTYCHVKDHSVPQHFYN